MYPRRWNIPLPYRNAINLSISNYTIIFIILLPGTPIEAWLSVKLFSVILTEHNIFCLMLIGYFILIVPLFSQLIKWPIKCDVISTHNWRWLHCSWHHRQSRYTCNRDGTIFYIFPEWRRIYRTIYYSQLDITDCLSLTNKCWN